MSALLAACAAWSLLAGAAPKKPRPAVPAAPAALVERKKAVGQVSFVTTSAVFVDRGEVDGLKVGAELLMTRVGAPVGRCRVEAVSPHSARCAGSAQLLSGDRFAVEAPAVQSPKALPPPLPSDDELDKQRRALESQPHVLKEFSGVGTRSVAVAGRLRGSVRHESWFRFGDSTRGFNRERIDLGLRGVDLFRGLRLWLDATVLVWSSRPSDSRYPVRTVVQPLIRQLEVSYREPDTHWTFGLGRTWPTTAPGLFMLDGAHVGYKGEQDAWEINAYGGLLPDDVTTYPTSRRWTAGAYGRVVLHGDESSKAVTVVSGRLGWLTSPQSVMRLEGQVALNAWLGRGVDVSAEVLMGNAGIVGAGGPVTSPGFLDGARLGVGFRPFERLQLRVDGRYQGGGGTPFSYSTALIPGQWVRGSSNASFEVASFLNVGAYGGVSYNVHSALLQAYVGPEVELPGLLKGTLNLRAGYSEEFGWLRGRSASLAALWRPASVFRLTVRGSYFQTVGTNEAPSTQWRDVGAFVSTDWRIAPWLSLRVSGLARVGLGEVTEKGRSVAGTTLSAEMVGQL